MDLEERNKQVVLAGINAFAERRMDDWRELWHPEATMLPFPGWPEQGPFEGRDAVEAQLKRVFELFPGWTLENVGIDLAQAEWVIASYSMRGRGAASGLEVDLHLFMAVRVGEDGLIREGHFFMTLDDALKSVAAD